MNERTETPARREPRTPDFELTIDELRAVTAFAVASAEQVLSLFEDLRPDDPRPRDALIAANAFAKGGKRSRAQRVTATAAHRAAKEAQAPAGFHAAMAAGDAAGSAYLHPLADVGQVGHILRASAHTVLAFETGPGGADGLVERIAALATPVLIDVLCRYPRTGSGSNTVGRIVHELDEQLRGASSREGGDRR